MRGSSLIAGILCLFILTGCAADLSNKSQFLSVGMTTQDAKSVLGDNGRPKNRQLNQQGQLMELWEYNDVKYKEKLWLCFTDYKLAKWAMQGRARGGTIVDQPSDLFDPIKIP